MFSEDQVYDSRDVVTGDSGSARLRKVFVAAFRSPSTEVIGEHLGFPVAVIAATDNPVRLRKHLSQTWHASWQASPTHRDQPFRKEDVDADDVRYELLEFDARWMRRRPFPAGVSLDGGVLHVQVPVGATASELDAFLGLALHDMRFDVVAQQPAEVLRRHASGLPADIGPRYACAPGRSLRSVVLVRNLYAFREQRDLPGLAGAVALAAEGLMLRHRLLSRSAASARATDMGQ